MTTDDRFDRDLVGWLRATAPANAPGGLHAAAIERAGVLRQRPGWRVAAGDATFGPSARVSARAPRTAIALGLVALLTLAVVAAVLLVTRRPPSRLGSNGAIIVSWQGNRQGMDAGMSGIALFDSAGNRTETKAERCATFSDDGRYLVYPKGENQTRLVLDPIDGSPALEMPMPVVERWLGFRSYELSPDATRVAWLTPGREVWSEPDADGGTSSITVDNEMWVSSVDGGERIRIATTDDAAGLLTYAQPRWSPDGSQVAFISWTSDLVDNTFVTRGGTIVIARTDGSAVRRLEPGRVLGETVEWSPDGKQLAYIGVPDGPFVADVPGDVFVIDADGTGLRNLTNSPEIESRQEWAPDGDSIAFLVAGPESSNVALIPMSGDTQSGSMITGPGTYDFTWSPDAQRILFIDTRTEPPLWDGTSPLSFSRLRTIDRRFVEAPSDAFGEVPGSVTCPVAWQRQP